MSTAAGATEHSRTMYASSNVPGIGGVLKQRPEDFLVEELPLYQPSGEGEHLYLLIEKRDATTSEIANALAQHFHVPKRAIGFAGYKDKHAVTRQLFSVHLPGQATDSFSAFEHPKAGVLWIDRHRNMLRRGHLAGNRFSIRVREVSPAAVVQAKQVLQILASQGLPNRIGEQRFGSKGLNHRIGRALWLGQWQQALDLLLGPTDIMPPAQRASANLYRDKNYAEALRALPRNMASEYAALRALTKGKSAADAWLAVPARDRGFFLSALQSAMFNEGLARRLSDHTYCQALPGDVLLDERGQHPLAVPIESPLEPDIRERVARLELGPSGPMWGSHMRRAGGRIDEIEVEALRSMELTTDDIASPADTSAEMTGGTRRPLRLPVRNCDVEGGVDEFGNYVRCSFELPRGGFATEVMREIMKPPHAQADDSTPAEDDSHE